MEQNATVSTELAIQAIEEERRRLARDIHDGPAQLLTNLTMRLEVVKEMVKYSPQTVVPEIQRIQDLMRNSVGELRRMIYDLRPVEIAEVGLVGALLAYAERCQYLQRTPVTVQAENTELELSETVGIGVFRIIQECITNSLKHAHAEHIDVLVSTDKDLLRITVRDDGNGFEALPAGPNPERNTGFGMGGMRERARLLGGDLEVQSTVGVGTEITIFIGLGGERESS